jgi:uroporphyrinogen-III synthase
LLVWVTRTRPAAEDTAVHLRERGFEPLVSPVLEVRPVEALINLDGVGALTFTSRNGVAAFAERSARRDLPVFAVGEATAEAARGAGFAHVEAAAGDVAALAEALAARSGEIAGEVLHPAASERAGDLSALLTGSGVKVRTLVVYETVDAEPAEALARLPALDAAVVHSPKAARRLAALLDPAAVPDVLFACISANAARPLEAAGFEKVLCAPFPDEAGLLKLLADTEQDLRIG